ncbi:MULTISPECIES: hypothetical protein [unclassified Bradyrhizobium]|uniref:hypothetical protein n=1 Tax=unclassified Bradyrhizobium TaxID=2631580 RepID=UPI002916D337|nr:MULTISPECIES: hypothetical protein [unclassified Bradyrhizobium]
MCAIYHIKFPEVQAPERLFPLSAREMRFVPRDLWPKRHSPWLQGNNIAGAASTYGFIANVGGPGPFVVTNPWLKCCYIQLYAEDNIESGGSINSQTIFQGPIASIGVPSGATPTPHITVEHGAGF